MSLTAFNRARRRAAELTGQSIETLSYEEATTILKQAATSGSSEPGEDGEADSDDSSQGVDQATQTVTQPLDRDSRIAELKAANWETLRDLLKEYSLPINKPKGVSWDEFAIPQILEHEGL